MATRKFTIPKISCAHCTRTIEMELGEMEGVNIITANVDTKEVVVEFDDRTSEGAIEELLVEIDYPPSS